MEGRYWQQPQRTWQREELGRQEHRQLGPVQAPMHPEYNCRLRMRVGGGQSWHCLFTHFLNFSGFIKQGSVENRTDASHLSRNLLQCLTAAENSWQEVSNAGTEMKSTQWLA